MLLVESAVRATLVALVIALVLWTMRIKAAAVRHAVWTSVVLLMLLLPAWVAWGPKALIRVLPPMPAIAIAPADPFPQPLPAGRVERAPADSARSVRESGNYSIYAVYFLGASVLLLRLAIGTIRANRLTSASCVVPITVGLLRPRIILPASSRDWPPAQMDVVMTHESEH